MTLGQRIAFYRKKQSLTQAGLGEQLSISAQAISKWENDQAEPDVATLIQLSKILNVPLDELLTGEAPTPTAPATTQAPTPKKEKKPSIIKKALRATAAFICKFKKILIPAVCLILVVATLLIVAPLTFMQPCSKWGYNRIEVGMDIAQVEKMLGAPHKKNITKELGGYTYDDDGSLGSSFSDGFLEGIDGESAKVIGGTYYYYHGAYGRTLEKLNKLEEEYGNLSINASDAKIERLYNKIIKLEEKLKELDQTGAMRIYFKNGKVTEVYIRVGDFKDNKK